MQYTEAASNNLHLLCEICAIFSLMIFTVLESLTSTILSVQLAGRDSPLRPEVAGNLLHYGR